MSSLQQNIINFTQRLHSAEVERRSLRMETTKLKDENCQLKRKTEHTENVDKELTRLRHEVCTETYFSRVFPLEFLWKGRWEHFQGWVVQGQSQVRRLGKFPTVVKIAYSLSPAIVPTCMCPWARHLVSIASLTWAHQGGVGIMIIDNSALYPLAKGVIQNADYYY